MPLETETQKLVDDDELRSAMFSDLATATRELHESSEIALTQPDDVTVPGWLIRRIFIPSFGIEMRLCRSTEAGVPYNLTRDQADDVTVIVQSGRLHIEYTDLGQEAAFDLGPGQRWWLPANIARTTVAAEHPTTLFALLYGRPQDNARYFAGAGAGA